MKFRKIAAAIMSTVMLSGIAGCDAGLKETELENFIVQYNSAICSLDPVSILNCTTWEKDDSDYLEIQDILDGKQYDEINARVYPLIAQTIEIYYADDELKINGDKATLKLEYRMIDWEELYSRHYDNTDRFEEDVRNNYSSLQKIIEDEIEFEHFSQGWRITKLKNLAQVYSFLLESPDIGGTSSTSEPDPADTGATTSETTDNADLQIVYENAITVYRRILEQTADLIKAAEDGGLADETCGLYDINSDGIPELYFLAANDTSGFSANLYIYSYSRDKDALYLIAEVPSITYMAADGGLFSMYVTSEKLVIAHAHGEDPCYHHDTDIYDLNLDITEYYRRDSVWDFEDDTYHFEYYKDDLENNPIGASEYDEVIDSIVKDAKIILIRNYANESLIDKEFLTPATPVNSVLCYQDMIEYCNYLIDSGD